MIKVYRGENEVLNAIKKNGEIHGVVKVKLNELINKNDKGIDDVIRERLVGSDFSYSVYNPSYSIAGVDVDTNSVFLNVTVDANELLKLKNKMNN